MNFNKIMSLIAVSAISVLSVCSTATATDYYNAFAEADQIQYFINEGLYLEAIQDSENTIAWHDLSPEDVDIFNNFKKEAEQKYNDYINNIPKSYYDATAEVNQINSFINQGLYYEAMAECENTIAWHELSTDDINLLKKLKSNAKDALNKYNKSKESRSYVPDVPVPQSDTSGFYDMNYWMDGGSSYIDVETARSIVASATGYPSAVLIDDKNGKWYFVPANSPYENVRGSGGNINLGTAIYYVDKSTGEFGKEKRR